MSENPEKAILGTGWSFPPTFTTVDYSVLMVSAEQDIRESLWILFSTTLGERIMLPDYGSELWQMIFRNINTSLITEIEEAVRQAVLYWEPRILVEDVSVEPHASTDGLLLVTVYYMIRQTNARNNLVYPFYIKEGTIPSQAP